MENYDISTIKLICFQAVLTETEQVTRGRVSVNHFVLAQTILTDLCSVLGVKISFYNYTDT